MLVVQHEDLTSNLKHSHKKPSVAMYACSYNAIEDGCLEAGGLLKLTCSDRVGLCSATAVLGLPTLM